LYLARTGVVAAAIAAAVTAGRRHHPFPRFGAANIVTSVRALLVAAVAGLIGEPHTDGVARAAVAIALVATVLDGVDGWLARRTATASSYGARYDLEVDTLLILVLAILTWRYGKAGVWVMLSGLLRYVFVAAGWVFDWMRAPLAPTFRGKAVCIIQIGGLLIALAPFVPPPLSTAVAAAALMALVWSFAVDTGRLWVQAR
jgi:phosphatidylglycerophosphate synthase